MSVRRKIWEYLRRAFAPETFVGWLALLLKPVADLLDQAGGRLATMEWTWPSSLLAWLRVDGWLVIMPAGLVWIFWGVHRAVERDARLREEERKRNRESGPLAARQAPRAATGGDNRKKQPPPSSSGLRIEHRVGPKSVRAGIWSDRPMKNLALELVGADIYLESPTSDWCPRLDLPKPQKVLVIPELGTNELSQLASVLNTPDPLTRDAWSLLGHFLDRQKGRWRLRLRVSQRHGAPFVDSVEFHYDGEQLHELNPPSVVARAAFGSHTISEKPSEGS